MGYKALDKNTYGNSKCSIELVDILNKMNNDSLSKSVSKLLQSFNCRVKDALHTKTYTEDIIRILFMYYKSVVHKSDFPIEIKTRVLNLITSEYRKQLNNLHNE